jgi:hypothetical protein
MVDILLWILVSLIVATGVAGGYFQLLLLMNLKKLRFSDVFFGAWLLDAENLNEDARYYRKAIIYCWCFVILLALAIFALRNV